MTEIKLLYSKVKPLSREEEERLIKLYKNGDIKAGHKIIESNQRFVFLQAQKLAGYGMSMNDMIQEGNIGMLKALERFEPYVGVRFITYAVHWIRASIQTYIFKMLCQVKPFTTQKVRSDLFKNCGRYMGKEYSLNTPIGEDGKEFIDLLESPNDIEDNLIELEMRMHVRRCAFSEATNDRDVYLIKNRLLSEDPKTLQEIGKYFGLSRERIRQIEKKLLENIKDAA